MRHAILLLLAVWLGLALAAPSGATLAAEGLDEVLDCMQRNFPVDSAVQDLAIHFRDRVGNERELAATLVWKRFEKDRSRVLVRVRAPDDLRGSALLLIQRDSGADLFSWVPALRKTRRITSQTLRGSLFGSDFTYEDFQRLHGMAVEGQSERLPDAELQSGPALVFAQRPAGETGSAYERVVSYVDRSTCLLAKAEMWEPGNRLRKVLTTDLASVFERDGIRIPRRVVLEDRKKGSSTRLELQTIDVERPVRKRDLSLSALEK